jgi:hypothetical protein
MSMPELIDVPVRATLAEHDNIWQSDEAARGALRQLAFAEECLSA